FFFACYDDRMQQVSIVHTTKNYVTFRVPRKFFHEKIVLSESDALAILRSGMREYRLGKTKKLASLKDLRNGN
ncbi:MAG TPA: hypothetical protein VJH89_00180, partial [Patescibacteria group bacterium]|nr:hypothetical protein [Patescibacteria group bacterium]